MASLLDEFVLGFLTCAFLSVTFVSLFVRQKKREEERLRQQLAVEILRNLNVAKLRRLLGDVSSTDLHWPLCSLSRMLSWSGHMPIHELLETV